MSFWQQESWHIIVGPWVRCLLVAPAVGQQLIVVRAVGEEDTGPDGGEFFLLHLFKKIHLFFIQIQVRKWTEANEHGGRAMEDDNWQGQGR